jgi:hypothetical protein
MSIGGSHLPPSDEPNTSGTPPPLPEAPYRGIEPFRFVDQRLFAAREEETWRLFSNITLYGAVLLYGASGTGKSSLINAGLLPKALENKYIPDRIRVQACADHEFKVDRIQKSDGESFAFLPSNFEMPEGQTALAASSQVDTFELSLDDFIKQLETFRLDERPEADHVTRPAKKPRPLLIFDQFEEFVTLFEEIRNHPTDDTKCAKRSASEIQATILNALVRLIQDRTLPVKIVFCFREDYFAKLSALFDRCPQLLDQSQRLMPPGLELVPKIIRAPFDDKQMREHFLTNEGHQQYAGSELSKELAQQIKTELGNRRGREMVNLTELQIVCLRLWESKTPEQLLDQSGIQGLLDGYVEEVIQDFGPELQRPTLAVLFRMITQSNTRNVVEENDLLSQAAKDERLPVDQLQRALTKLVESRLVRREARRDIYFYELTSEYLVHWIGQRRTEREATREQEQARKVLDAFSDEQHEASIKLLLRLITSSNTRKMVEEGELLNHTTEGEPPSREVLSGALAALVENGIVRRETRLDRSYIEITSDRIIPWINELRATARLDQIARQERHRARLFKRLVLTFAILLAVLLLGVAALYFYQRSLKADQALRVADEQRRAAETLANMEKQEKDKYVVATRVIAGKDRNEKLEALAQIRKWNSENAFPPNLLLLLTVAQATTEDREVKQALRETLTQTAKDNPDLSQSIVSAAETNASLAAKLPQRFYIHVADDSQTGLAQQVANALKKAGYLVPGIQQAENAPKWDNELRYFKRSEDTSIFTDVVSQLRATTRREWHPKYNSLYENSPKVGPGYFELWFALPRGVLSFNLYDDAHNSLKGPSVTVVFEPTSGFGVPFKSRASRIAVPRGDYNVIISVKGYRVIQRSLSIKGDEEIRWPDLILIKENAGPSR